MFGLPIGTSFRMFPRADTVPNYPTTEAYGSTMLSIMLVPYFISCDRSMDSRGPLGRVLRPLTRRASPLVEYSVVFGRLWLATGWVNMATAQFMTDFCACTFAAKLGCVTFIL